MANFVGRLYRKVVFAGHAVSRQRIVSHLPVNTGLLERAA